MSVTKEDYLKTLANELHKPVKRKFKRRKISFQYLDQTWCMDLVQMDNKEWVAANDGYKYLLTCVDGWSRYAWAVPMKTKTAKDTYVAFASICEKSGRSPDYLWVDKGGEFVNSYFKKAGYSDDDGTMYHTYGESKSVIVERFNRTLKTQMWKVCAEKQTLNWVDEIPELLDWYNNRIHSSLGPYLTPAKAVSGKFDTKVSKYVDHTVGEPPERDLRVSKFKLGDWVRVSKAKGPFTKGYESGWSVEQFKIIAIVRPNNVKEPLVYKLEDYNGERIEGTFYTEELQKVAYPELYLVDKTLKERGKGKNKEYFVSWVGYPSEYNSWIKNDDVAFDFTKI